MKKTVLLLTLFCVLTACKKNSVGFTYSPSEPRAGQSVLFTNQSSSGEEWEWAFGDGSTSTLKSPNHIYRNPGTYMVTLKVDKKKAWMASKQITVYDTVPTFVASDSLFQIYKQYTFTAHVYNPYNLDIQYAWSFPAKTPYVGGIEGQTSSTMRLHFRQAMSEAPIQLTIICDGDTLLIEKTFNVEDRPTNSVLVRTPEKDYRQRIFGEWADLPYGDASAAPLLDAAQDTMQTYNGKEFKVAELSAVFPGIEGFRIANRKIYYRANGLWVANIDGAYPVQIDTAACAAMTIDTHDNRIYWANQNGVWYMPFVGSDNNRFVTEPVQLNNLSDVTRIAPDYDPK